MRDIAQLANVSVATVSLVLNGKDGVGEETRSRILDLVREKNYRMNMSAQVLKTKKNKLIGVIVPDIQNPFYSWVVAELDKSIIAGGYTLFLGISNNSVQMQNELIDHFYSRGVEGVILVPHSFEMAYSKQAAQFLFPVVFCSVFSDCECIPSVFADLREGEYEAVKYLLGKGMRSIAFVGADKKRWYTQKRYEGLCRAFAEYGVRHEERFLFTTEPTYQSGYEIAPEVVAERPEAIVAINDFMAMGILQYLREKQIRVPEDISVIGFDDIIFASQLNPALTTVRQPIEEIARTSVEVLLQTMNEGLSSLKERHFVIPTKLQLRETTK